MVHKIIVTNRKVMRRKYGNAGWKRIQSAVAGMIQKDAVRGCKSFFVSMDLKSEMKKFDGPQVADSADEKQNKEAIDALFDKARPDYLLILGAPDVVPHQSLANPMGDDDDQVPSDLPYACEAPYSDEIADFKGPTRVIGRLPDVVGGDDTQYLMNLLDTGDRKLLLRKKGGHPFHDDVIEALVGQRIKCRGFRKGAHLFLESWEPETKPN